MTTRPVSLFARVLALLALCAAPSLRAQQVSATLSQSTASPGQTVEYTITYEGPQANLDLLPQPAVPGLDIQGPQTSQSMAFQSNGAQSFQYNLTWFLTGAAPARHVIPPQVIAFSGQSYTTPELVLEVKDGPLPAASFDPLLRLSVAKNELYVGEVTPITVTALFHRRTQLRNYDHPKLPRENFVVKRFPPAGPAQSVDINGERYQPIQFSSSISALIEGDVDLGPASLDCVIDFPAADDSIPPRRTPQGFPPSFFQRMSTRKFTLTSDTVKIKVKPLPAEGRPADFAGAVGRFTLATQSSQLQQQPAQSVRVGDPISVDLFVTGTGNFDRLAAPLLETPDGWKTYPAKVTQENRSTGLEPGTQVYNQVIIPQQPGGFVPAFQFSFFDPQTEQYHTARSQPIALTILPEETKPAQAASEAPTKDFSAPDAAIPDEKLDDILTLRPLSGPMLSLTPQARGETMFWAAQAVPAALLLAFIGMGIQRRARERAAAVRRQREGQPRPLADIRRDLKRSGLTRRDFYALAREYVSAWEFHQQKSAAAAGLNGGVQTVLQRQSLYSYGGAAAEASAAIQNPEQKEILSVLDRL